MTGKEPVTVLQFPNDVRIILWIPFAKFSDVLVGGHASILLASFFGRKYFACCTQGRLIADMTLPSKVRDSSTVDKGTNCSSFLLSLLVETIAATELGYHSIQPRQHWPLKAIAALSSGRENEAQ